MRSKTLFNKTRINLAWMGILAALTGLYSTSACSQNLNRQVFEGMEMPAVRRILSVPSFDGYQALRCDLHMHTVFSDGEVWPDIRVHEAWADGLDAIAITDHDRYHTYKKYVEGPNDIAYEIAGAEAAKKDILLVRGIEVTRRMPPGHFNALFITDGNFPELQDTSWSVLLASLEKLAGQGAVLVWNHPGWAAQQKDTVKWFERHSVLLEKGWLKGIEVFNYNEWYPVALEWARQKGLAPMANSDVHGPMRLTYDYSGGFIRPMTLAFARERSIGGLKEAILSGRTVAWFNGHLAGPQEILTKLFSQTLSTAMILKNKGKVTWQLTNPTDLTMVLQGMSESWDGEIRILPRSAVTVTLTEGITSVPVEVTNWHTGMKDNLKSTLVLAH